MNSLWLDSVSKNISFSSLPENKKAQVCIIGAGIFGLTCAYYLTKLGYHVIVLEKDNIGEKATGHTTGKITSQHSLFYDYLIQSYGEKFAKNYLFANEQAIQNIQNIIQEEKIKCDFTLENSYVYTTKNSELRAIKKEISALDSLGFHSEFVTKLGLPFEIEGAICFKNQAQFHPLKYLYGLASSITNHNGEIFTHTTVTDVQKEVDSYVISTNRHTVVADFVIMASHYPFINFPGFYFTKMYQSTSYLIAVDTKKTLPHGMYINFTNPIFSYRTARYQGKDILLIGGGEHKTGQPTCYQDSYGLLEEEAFRYYPDAEILYRWNTRDCISLDKLPYVGIYSSMMPNVFVGTGFKKWGMTLTNVAANIIVDEICGKQNPYQYLFRSTRLKPLKNHDEMKNILVQSTTSLFFDKLKLSPMQFENIANNSGGIVEINHEKVGIYKDENGKIYAVKPICTHLGCLLSWNDVDKTWDCPCHGSRFDYQGKNLYDPAFKDLDVYVIDS